MTGVEFVRWLEFVAAAFAESIRDAAESTGRDVVSTLSVLAEPAVRMIAETGQNLGLSSEVAWGVAFDLVSAAFLESDESR
jgi:hypothetical protein